MVGCLAFATFACKINENRPDLGNTDAGPILTAITVSPSAPTLADPSSLQLTATGTYTDGTSADITNSVHWISEYPTVATISDRADSTSDPKGKATTVSTGSTTITARAGDIAGATTLTVTSPVLDRIEITPARPSLPLALTPTVQFYATGIYTDNTVLDLTPFANWGSSNNGVATVSNVTGRRGSVNGIAIGSAVISAAYADKTGSTTVVFNNATRDTDLNYGDLTFYPIHPTLARGTTQQFTATVRLSNGKRQDVTEFAVWDATNDTVASISNAESQHGWLMTHATHTGISGVDASYDTATGSPSQVTVSSAYLYNIAVQPGYPTIAFGSPAQLRAIGIFRLGDHYHSQDISENVTWSSSDTSVASVSNAAGSKGLITTTTIPSVLQRTTTIDVKSPLSTTLTGTTQLTVNPPRMELAAIEVTTDSLRVHKDGFLGFSAIGRYADSAGDYYQDITDAVVWGSSVTTVAAISNQLLAKGKAVLVGDGTTVISADLGGISGKANLSVMPESYLATAVTVTPATPVVGTTTQLALTATATFSNGTDSFTQDVTDLVYWHSGDTTKAMVSNAEGSRGIVTGIATGTAVLTAFWKTYLNSSSTYSLKDGAVTVTVIDISNLSDITLSGTCADSISNRRPCKRTATASYTGSTLTQDVTESTVWESSRPQIAAISNLPGEKGKLYPNSSGSTVITARVGTKNKTETITVALE